METIYYKKVGKRYIPVKSYDHELSKAFPQGAHLVVVNNNWTHTTKNIDPDFAALCAASLSMNDILVKILSDASKMRINKELTPAQVKAWRNLEKALGETAYLEYPALVEVSSKFLDELEEKTKELMKNPSIKLAYDKFEMLCKLSKNQEQTNEKHT